MVQKTKKTDKVWGAEYLIVNNGEYCGKRMLLNKKARCSTHCHKDKLETFYVLSGAILLELGCEEYLLGPGDVVTVNRNEYHRFTGLEESSFFEFSTVHQDSDSYRKTQSEILSDEDFRSLLDQFNRE